MIDYNGNWKQNYYNIGDYIKSKIIKFEIMIQFNDFKAGDYIKCVQKINYSILPYTILSFGSSFTPNRIYKIKSISNISRNNEVGEYLCCIVCDNDGIEQLVLVYSREFLTKKIVTYKWYYLYIPKNEYLRGEIKSENINFIKSTELEAVAQNYNL
jgi:hypothetical protein